MLQAIAGTKRKAPMDPQCPWIAKTGAVPAAAVVTARDRQTRVAGPWRFVAACWGIAAALLSASAPAPAEPVTYAFTGVFDVPNGSLDIYTDTSFQGSFTYDPDIPPLPEAQAGAANYDALIAFDLEILDVPSPESFALRVGLAAGAPTAQIGIDEATNGAPSDAFKIIAATGPRGFIESPFPWNFFLLILTLERISGSVFDDALSLPPALALGDFDRTHVRLLLDSEFATDPLVVDGRITSLELIDTPPIGVPEPGTLELLAIAAGVLSVVLGRAEGPRRRSPRHRLVPPAGPTPSSGHRQAPGNPT